MGKESDTQLGYRQTDDMPALTQFLACACLNVFFSILLDWHRALLMCSWREQEWFAMDSLAKG